MPAERPGSVTGRSSCVPCGRSRRQSSPGDAPMHHWPTRSLYTTSDIEGLCGADPHAISDRHPNARGGGVAAKVELLNCKGSRRIRGWADEHNAAWAGREHPCNRKAAVGREAGAGESPGCLVEGDVRRGDRHQLPALGCVSGALPLVLERISAGVGVVEIPALFALGGIGGIAGGGGGHWSSQHTDHHTQGTQHQHYSTHLLLLPVLEGSGHPLPSFSPFVCINQQTCFLRMPPPLSVLRLYAVVSWLRNEGSILLS